MPDTIPIITRRASIAPQSVNLDARTVDVTWSTGAPVKRRDVEGGYIERLSLDANAVDLSRLIGASVLDAHRQTAVRDVLGTVRDASVTGRQGVATIQFSARPEVEPIWQDVTAGILRHISVGYSVEQWADSIKNGTRVRTATRWTPHEISLVPSPADPGATVRMEDTNMEHQTTAPDNNPAQNTTTNGETAPDAVQTRATINTEIRSIANVAGLDQSFVDGLIDRQADADEARRAAFDELAKRGGGDIRTEQTRVEIGDSHDDPEFRARQMGEALYSRINPGHELSEPARRYAYATPVDMAKELLALLGFQTTGLSPASMITRALHTTSDFPIILGDTVGRTLRDAYQAAPSGISDTTLSAARLALRTQKGLSGQPVRATPKYLMVPPALETVAEKWLATVAAAKAEDVNPFSGSLSLVVEPRLASTTRWYVTADPSEIDGLEFAYLAGGEGPQVESKSGWDVDGVEIRVILDFGAGFIDHRGWFANAGA